MNRFLWLSVSCILALNILGSLPLQGQTITLPKSIVIIKHPDFGLLSKYEVKKGNTLFSISKAYATDIQSIKKINPLLAGTTIDPGDTIMIPFNPRIIDFVDQEYAIETHIPIYYKTAARDNLFRIARVYFDQTIEKVMRKNQLNNFDLKKNQLILIGWKKIAETSDVPPKEEIVLVSTKPDVTPIKLVEKLDIKKEIKPATVDSLTIEAIEKHEIISQNGLAIWNKTSKASGIFALHNQAKTGTLLEITSPLSNRKIYVKVIGHIPANSYPANVKVILSPEAAKSLGVLDSRFYVKMHYIKG